jgi:hypothetical protein
VISDWLKYRYIYHVPLALLATGLELIAVMLMAIGLTLDSIVHQQRLAFERDILNTPVTMLRDRTKA